MDQEGKNGSRPTPDAGNMKSLAFKLFEALDAERNNFDQQPNTLVSIEKDRKPWEVTTMARDQAVSILRFLRFWYDLPSEVFFEAVHLLDQFLARMKVQERYLKCLTISCFHVAATDQGYPMDKQNLITLSQCKCSVKDMERMANIVQQKLQSVMQTSPAGFLHIFLDTIQYLNSTFVEPIPFIPEIVDNKESLVMLLEVLMTDRSCALYRPSALALHVIRHEIEKQFSLYMRTERSIEFLRCCYDLFTLMAHLEDTSRLTMSAEDGEDDTERPPFTTDVLQTYENIPRSKHQEKLLWRFSQSTYALGNRNRTNRHGYHALCTIVE